MYLERFVIVVPTLANPRLPIGTGVYFPSIIEWGELLGCFSLFALFYLLFTKFFPIISLYELEEGKTIGLEEIMERYHAYQPAPSEIEPKSQDAADLQTTYHPHIEMAEEEIPPGPSERLVAFLQYGILASFVSFVLCVIGWISYLVYNSQYWHDVPSASIGISLVAIPVYLIMLGVFNYLFWGLKRG
jgi:hypothetical protein